MKVVDAGADLVSGRLTMLLSKKGRALRWKKDEDDDDDNNGNTTTAIKSSDIKSDDSVDNDITTSALGKKRPLDSISKANDNNDDDNDDAIVDTNDTGDYDNDGYSINLWDDKYTRDSRPLQKGCICHACRYYYY